MIEGIPKLIITLGTLAGKLVNNAVLKDAIKRSVNLLNWCYKEIRRLQQLLLNSIEREKQKDVIISELKQKLAKYENNG